MLFGDVERTLEGLSLTHPGEVAGYRRYLDDLLPVARLLGDLMRRPPGPREIGGALARTRGRGAPLAVGRLSPPTEERFTMLPERRSRNCGSSS